MFPLFMTKASALRAIVTHALTRECIQDAAMHCKDRTSALDGQVLGNNCIVQFERGDAFYPLCPHILYVLCFCSLA